MQSGKCTRIIDYFVVCGIGTSLRPVQPLQEDTEICRVEFTPKILDRYPEYDYKDSPLPETIPMFCFPNGSFVFEDPPSRFIHEFVLTLADGTPLYCTSILIPEEFRVERIENVSIHNPHMYAPPPTPVTPAARSRSRSRTGSTGGSASASHGVRSKSGSLFKTSSSHHSNPHLLGPLRARRIGSGDESLPFDADSSVDGEVAAEPIMRSKFRFIRGERGPIRLYTHRCICFMSHFDDIVVLGRHAWRSLRPSGPSADKDKGGSVDDSALPSSFSTSSVSSSGSSSALAFGRGGRREKGGRKDTLHASSSARNRRAGTISLAHASGGGLIGGPGGIVSGAGWSGLIAMDEEEWIDQEIMDAEVLGIHDFRKASQLGLADHLIGLGTLFRAIVGIGCDQRWNPSPLVEEVIRFVTREVPVPPRGKTCVLVKPISTEESAHLALARCPPNELYPDMNGLEILFRTLDIHSVLMVFTCLLCEIKLLFFHPSSTVLTRAMKSIIRLLLPFHFCHVFIPVLPMALQDFLNAPIPFAIGMVGQYDIVRKWGDALYIPAEEEQIVIVDMVQSRVYVPESVKQTIPPLPEERMKLMKCLNRHVVEASHAPPSALSNALAMDSSHQTLLSSGSGSSSSATSSSLFSSSAPLPQPSFITTSASSSGSTSSSISSSQSSSSGSVLSGSSAPAAHAGPLDHQAIQAGFLRFFVSLMKNYKNFFSDETRDAPEEPERVFDTRAFVKSQSESNRPFLNAFVQTQLFEYFIQQRSHASSEKISVALLHEIAFFDEHIVRKKNRSRTRKHEETPFLDDPSFIHSSVFEPIPPMPRPLMDQIALPTTGHGHGQSGTQSGSGSGSGSGTRRGAAGGSLKGPRKGAGKLASFPALNRSRFGHVKYIYPLLADPESFDMDSVRSAVKRNAYLKKIVFYDRTSQSDATDQDDRAVFCRNPIRMAIYGQSAAVIRKWWLRFKCRRHYLQLLQGAAIMQARVKMRLTRQVYLRRRGAAITIQKNTRSMVARKKFHRIRQLVIVLQGLWRGVSIRKSTIRVYKKKLIDDEINDLCVKYANGVLRPALRDICDAFFPVVFEMEGLSSGENEWTTKRMFVLSWKLKDARRKFEEMTKDVKAMKKRAAKENQTLYKMVRSHIPASKMAAVFRMFVVTEKKKRKKILFAKLFTLSDIDFLRASTAFVTISMDLPGSASSSQFEDFLSKFDHVRNKE